MEQRPHGRLLAGLVGLWCAGTGLAAGPTTAFEQRHAGDRVAWRFWSPEAVDAARTADRPVLLSIGFEGCPGCEQMSQESFGDAAVAQIMNSRFTCLLLDAEDWPAAATQYAALAEALGVPPVYPLNLFLTPDLRPFAAVGYLPPEPTSTAPGWAATVARIADQYDPARANAAGQVLLADVAARLDTSTDQ